MVISRPKSKNAMIAIMNEWCNNKRTTLVVGLCCTIHSRFLVSAPPLVKRGERVKVVVGKTTKQSSFQALYRALFHHFYITPILRVNVLTQYIQNLIIASSLTGILSYE